MPYADKEKQREAQARWYREKYQANRKFQRAEAERKAAWLQTEEGKLSNMAASALAREKQRQANRPAADAPTSRRRA